MTTTTTHLADRPVPDTPDTSHTPGDATRVAERMSMTPAGGGAGREPDSPATWVSRVAEHPAGPAALVVFAVLEACLFPAPTEALFLALGVGRPRRSWYLAALATVGSLVGATVGYVIGAAFFERVGRPVLAWAGLLGGFEAVGEIYRGNVYLALLTSGYTPIPYVLYTIAAGAYGISLVPFLVGSAVGRGIKYALLGVLTYTLGPAVRRVLQRATGWVIAALAVAVLLVWWLRTR